MFLNNSFFRIYISGFLKGLNFFISFFFSIYMAKILEPDTFGLLLKFILVINLFSLISSFGYERLIVAHSAIKDSIKNHKSILTNISLICLILLPFIIIYVFFISKSLTTSLLISFSILIASYIKYLNGILIARDRIELASIFDAISKPIFILIISYLFIKYLSLTDIKQDLVSFILLISSFLNFYILLRILNIKLSIKNQLFSFFGNNLSFLLISLSLILNSNFPLYILTFFDNKVYTDFAIAMQFCMLISIFYVISNQYFIKYIRTNKLDSIQFTDFLKKYKLSNHIYSILCFILLNIFYGHIINFFYDLDLSNSIYIFRVLSVAFLINALVGPTQIFMMYGGYSKVFLKISFINLLSSLLISTLFLNLFGFIGLAYSFLMVSFFVSCYQHNFIVQKFKINFIRK